MDDCWVAGEWEVPPHLWGAPPPETFLANAEPAEVARPPSRRLPGFTHCLPRENCIQF